MDSRVDPVGELVEESILPPLPPGHNIDANISARTRNASIGNGHVNIIVDLSGSMTQGAILDSLGNTKP